MHHPLKLFVCLVFFLALTRGLPIPGDSNSNMAPFGVFPLAYSRRGLSLFKDRSSSTGFSAVGRPQVWGGTPANTSICRYPSLWTGKWWWIMISVALTLIVFYGLLAFVMWGVMSVDLPRLMVWKRTGDEQRRVYAGKVLKVRNRPDWLLVSLVVVSVAILEILPLLWSHLFVSSNATSYVTGNMLILVSQVGPTFVMPVFHLEVSGRFTWLVRLVMWFSAPVTVLPAYALRRLKRWRKRGQQPHVDGLLPMNELKEFIYLHEKGQGYGGTLDDHVGKMMRDLMQGQISGEAPIAHLETEWSQSIQFTESVDTTSVQRLHQEGPTAVENESTDRPTSIRSHRLEGSTAIEDIRMPRLRKRSERSTDDYDPVVSLVSMQVPSQAVLKDPIRPINNRYVEADASNGQPLQREFSPENLSSSVTPGRDALMESYRNNRKDSGLVTDSFQFEQG